MGQSSQALQEDDVADYHLSDVDMKFLDDGEDQNATANADIDEEWVKSTPRRQSIGNVTRINVLPANNIEEPTICRHSKARLSCTICNRPRGRCGREFKNKQDDHYREARRRKSFQRTKFC